jgi:hypothetical protein
LRNGDAAAALSDHSEVDLLHIDLSNDGDTYRDYFAQWAPRVASVILLEGGSLQRDQVPWMKRYEKASIRQAIAELSDTHRDWIFATVEPFPSITVALRR